MAKGIRGKYPKCQLILVTGHMPEAQKETWDLSIFENNIVQKAGNYLDIELPNAIIRAAKHFHEILNRSTFSEKIGRKDEKVMWALGKQSDSNGLQYFNVPLPLLPNESVLVQTASIGVCGTDIHAFGGDQKHPYDLVEFHEALGRVVWKGKHVSENLMSVGDIVIPIVRRCQTWDAPKGNVSVDFTLSKCPLECTCYAYRRPDICPFGEYPQIVKGQSVGYRSRGTGKCHGFGSEFFADTPEWLVKVCSSDELKNYSINLLNRLILAEPLSVVWKMKREIEQSRSVNAFRDRLLVIGMGPIGYLATLVMHTMNPGLRCTTVDLIPKDKPWIKSLQTDIIPEVEYHRLKEGQTWSDKVDKTKYDIIIEATGDHQAVIGKAIDSLAPNGILVVLSITGKSSDANVVLDSSTINKIVKGNNKIIGSVNEAREDFENAINFIKIFHSKETSLLDQLIHRLKIDKDVIDKVKNIKDISWDKREEGPKIVMDAYDSNEKTGKTVLESLANTELTNGTMVL